MFELAITILSAIGCAFLGFIFGDMTADPKFFCLKCDVEVSYNTKFCSKCGAEKDWQLIERSNAALPIFMGKWRIKI